MSGSQRVISSGYESRVYLSYIPLLHANIYPFVWQGRVKPAKVSVTLLLDTTDAFCKADNCSDNSPKVAVVGAYGNDPYELWSAGFTDQTASLTVYAPFIGASQRNLTPIRRLQNFRNNIIRARRILAGKAGLEPAT